MSTCKHIAVVTSDLEYFNASICTGLYQMLSKHNFKISIYLTFENEEKEKECVSKLIRQNQVSGLVIFSSMHNPLFYKEILYNNHLPVIFVDRLIPYLNHSNFVTVDNYGGGNKIGKILVEKGAKNIACLSMLLYNRLCSMEDRLNGFRDSHSNNPEISSISEEIDYLDTLKSMKDILSKWYQSQYSPDAIFATNHLIMNALISSIKQNKDLDKLLDKCTLSCFDNLPYFDWIDKPIISVEQPINDIVFYVGSILMKQIQEPDLSKDDKNIILPVKIIDRTN
ncbi:MAG: hypothetical protein AB1304_06470 [Bacteroidota bacterium]